MGEGDVLPVAAKLLHGPPALPVLDVVVAVALLEGGADKGLPALVGVEELSDLRGLAGAIHELVGDAGQVAHVARAQGHCGQLRVPRERLRGHRHRRPGHEAREVKVVHLSGWFGPGGASVSRKEWEGVFGFGRREQGGG